MPPPDPAVDRRPSAPEVGRRREDEACRYLCDRGLRLVERNYRCRLGEIDLIMTDGAHLVFVEVRYRRSARFGDAAESIVASKRRRVIMAARHYLHAHRGFGDRAVRFDVVAIAPGDQGPVFKWIRDAFQS